MLEPFKTDGVSRCKQIPNLNLPGQEDWKEALHTFSIVVLSVSALFSAYLGVFSLRLCRRKKVTSETKVTLIVLYLINILVTGQLILFLLT